ncbi:flagellar hook assembly protein FlgD [Aquibacillus halophilus]|uniref:Flagellar hook assembly protein FlgD n=1 Tax=Aquibacillus halophilus TaxID=930132 RepID=A0A6A8D919_9BACI|nr:flagellar hook assembly protein FlgD [Aquibacillus halophilus]MRH42263.1 flagellar hook assembly protein FlgD [Aquibacillus halophilus]
MTKIDPSLYLNPQTRGTTNSNLGKDEFLKILMAQLQNQDPLNPMQDKEFISQMATFSSLEQMMNMSNSIGNLANNLSVSPVVQYSSFIDKEVSYYRYDTDTGAKLDLISSKVKAVSQYQGTAVLELENGEKINADEIEKVSSITEE